MSLQYGVYLDIISAEVVGDYKIELKFGDGHTNVVNFEPFISRSQNSSIHQFIDLKKFNSFRLDWGNLVWGDFDMCFSVEDLYTGELIKRPLLAVAEDSEEWGESSERV